MRFVEHALNPTNLSILKSGPGFYPNHFDKIILIFCHENDFAIWLDHKSQVGFKEASIRRADPIDCKGVIQTTWCLGI